MYLIQPAECPRGHHYFVGEVRKYIQALAIAEVLHDLSLANRVNAQAKKLPLVI